MTDDPKEITVGLRAEENPKYVPESERRPCEKCGNDVWISPATKQEIELGIYPDTIYCVKCARPL